MADPTVRATASTSVTSVSSVTVNKPTGTVDGDGMIAVIITVSLSTPDTINTLSGWTLIDSVQTSNGGGIEVQKGSYYKKASSEGASYTFTFSGTTDFADGSIATIKDVKAGATWIGSTALNTGTGTTTTFTGVTAKRGSLILLNMNDVNGGARTPPSTFTEYYDGLHYAATKAGFSAGATGNFTMTNSNVSGSEQWVAHTIEVLAEPIGNRIIQVKQGLVRAAYW